jgi:hypothetical protein
MLLIDLQRVPPAKAPEQPLVYAAGHRRGVGPKKPNSLANVNKHDPARITAEKMLFDSHTQRAGKVPV